MPAGSAFHTVVGIPDGLLSVVGYKKVLSISQLQDKIFRYKASTNTWSIFPATVPGVLQRSSAFGAFKNGAVYIFGGRNLSGTPVLNVMKIHVAGGVVYGASTGSVPAGCTSGHALASTGNAILIFCNSAGVYEYDTVTASFTWKASLSPVPKAVSDSCGLVWTIDDHRMSEFRGAGFKAVVPAPPDPQIFAWLPWGGTPDGFMGPGYFHFYVWHNSSPSVKQIPDPGSLMTDPINSMTGYLSLAFSNGRMHLAGYYGGAERADHISWGPFPAQETACPAPPPSGGH